MIKYVKGDLFEGIKGKGAIIIPHIVNNIGAWGSGFVIPLAQHFPLAKKYYLEDYKKYQLGDCQTVWNMNNVAVINMFAQEGIAPRTDWNYTFITKPPIRYVALIQAMQQIAKWSSLYEIHAPKFGSGLAGGDWNLIEKLIDEIWADFKVTIYYL
jgi:hypothetical protein